MASRNGGKGVLRQRERRKEKKQEKEEMGKRQR
jgi:hypothetical protein